MYIPGLFNYRDCMHSLNFSLSSFLSVKKPCIYYRQNSGSLLQGERK